MNLDEASTLLVATRAIYPAMTIVPGIADAWLGMLGDLRLGECQAALVKWGRTESRIPAPADIRKLALSARQDEAMRALPTQSDELIPMPADFHQRVAYWKQRTRDENRARRDAGERPYYGETVKKPSDGRPGW